MAEAVLPRGLDWAQRLRDESPPPANHGTEQRPDLPAKRMGMAKEAMMKRWIRGLCRAGALRADEKPLLVVVLVQSEEAAELAGVWIREVS